MASSVDCAYSRTSLSLKPYCTILYCLNGSSPGSGRLLARKLVKVASGSPGWVTSQASLCSVNTPSTPLMPIDCW